MQARFVFGGITSSATEGSASWANKKPELLRLMVTKAPNRAAVHGHGLPPTETIVNKEVDKEVKKGEEEKESKKTEVEKTVDSGINRSDCIYPPAT